MEDDHRYESLGGACLPTTAGLFDLQFLLRFKLAKLIQINLIDQYGRIVSCLQNGIMRPGKNKLHFETGELSPGIYYLHVIVGEKEIFKKIVKF
jgi:hypothetical protein